MTKGRTGRHTEWKQREGIVGINWNVAGGKFLMETLATRRAYRARLNEELNGLVRDHKPDFITLQEIVRYEDDSAGRGHTAIHPISGSA